MNTDTAQRRLLEALADLRNTPNPDQGTAASPLAAFGAGVQFASRTVTEQGQPDQARIFAALADLAQAVDHDQRQELSHD